MSPVSVMIGISKDTVAEGKCGLGWFTAVAMATGLKSGTEEISQFCLTF